MRKPSEGEVRTDSKVTWYLPRRFFVNPKKPDRLSRVYDASAKFRGQSLNDKIYTRVDYLSSLFGAPLRFCEIVGRLPESDQPAVRFLWRESTYEKPSVYQFEGAVFGEVSGISRAKYTMMRNADDNGAHQLLGVKPVYKHF